VTDAASRRLRRAVNVAGLVAGLGYVVHVVSSYRQARVLWHRAFAPNADGYLDQLCGSCGFGLFDTLSTEGEVIVFNALIQALISIAAIGLIVLLWRNRDGLTADIGRSILKWAIAFAIITSVAFPVFAQDFWLSAVWGSMVVAGDNPYETAFLADWAAAFPLDHFSMKMSYGPLVALLSAAVMTIADDDIVLTALLFKALLLAAWIGALFAIAWLGRRRGVVVQCLAVAIFGWLPVGVVQSLGEGHNDIWMVCLALLWLVLMERGRLTAPLLLALSVLVKYVTVALVAVDFLLAVKAAKQTFSRIILRYVAPSVVGVGVLLIFARSTDFLAGAIAISDWRFLQPRDAIEAVGTLISLPLKPLGFLALAIFPAIALYQAVRFARTGDATAADKLAIALMATMALSAINHLWPWYVIWMLAFAVLQPGWALSRYIIGIALLAPFTLAFWWLPILEDHKDLAAVPLHGGALLWMAATRAIQPGTNRTSPV